MVKPLGALSLSSGSFSAAVGIGGGATGASLLAASVSGRPISGEPGGNGAGCWAAGGAVCCSAAAGGACCWAAAGGAAASKLPRVPASTSAWVIMVLPSTADVHRAFLAYVSSWPRKPPLIAAHRNLLHIVSVP